MFRNYNLTIKLTSFLTTALVNDARFSFVRNVGGLYGNAPLTAAQAGIVPSPELPDLPTILVMGMFQVGPDFDGGEIAKNENYQASDQLTWTKGKHNIRMGGGFERVRAYENLYGPERGAILIPTFPDFLLGLPAGLTGTPFSNLLLALKIAGVSAKHRRINNWNLFVQDDFKLHPQLTLNLGLRWEINGQPKETNGIMANFDPSLAVPIPPAGGTYTGLVVPSNFPGDIPAGVTRSDTPTTLRGTPMRNFGPRIGLAWQPIPGNKNLVVHAGYGIFYTHTSDASPIQLNLNPPYGAYLTFGGPFSPISLQQPFNPPPPSGDAFPLWNLALRTVDSKLSVARWANNFRSPMMQQWGLNMQYELKGGVLVQVGYVGSHGTHLLTVTQFNRAQLASPAHPINGETASTLENINMRVPIVGYTPDGIRSAETSGASLYHGLEATVRKRLSRGLQVQASYTFSKTLNTLYTIAGNAGASLSNGLSTSHVSNGYGLAEFSRPNRFVLSYLYTFPNYKGASGALGKLLSGWQLSGVTTMQSGNPLTLVDSTVSGSIYGANTGAYWYMPANFCAGSTNGSLSTDGSIQSRLDKYINTAAVCAPPVIGNGFGFGNIGRGALRGPGQSNSDVSIGKITKVKGPTEAATIEFRAQFFNAFNTPQFANPLTDKSSPGFGEINATSVSPRLIQFALKYNF
jgi:hypothetical protein